MPSIGGPELIFILVIVLIVFGAGRLPDVFSQIGKGVRAFRDESTKTDTTPPATTAATKSGVCASCGAAINDGAKFCAACGKPVAP
jgi:sec-independent protein translocase protein TatA